MTNQSSGPEGTYYGYRRTEWGRARDELAAYLTSVAKARSTTTYTDVVHHIACITLEPHSFALAALLGEVSSDDDDHGKGMRSALVLARETLEAGSGFFALAEGRGHDISDPMRFWIEMLDRVYADWG